ncbi:MAG: VCBS repeat-containing protein, partial [Planctomycetes bacterium]|nr:VCBS repeat-containing protein [Planctomycetota bacterium]
MLLPLLSRSRALAFFVIGIVGAATLSAQQPHSAKLRATGVGSWYGRSCAVEGDTLIVGASNATSSGVSEAGAAYVYTLSNGDWVEQQRLEAGDPAVIALFGYSVALSGDTAVVGARTDFHPTASSNIGAAYVFTRSGGVWTQEAKLVPADAVEGILFGASVAIDGDHVIVGASLGRDASGGAVGAVYFFERVGGVWTEQRKIAGPSGGGFGSAVALEGDTAAVGAFSASYAAAQGAGQVQVLMNSGGTWSVQEVLHSPNPQVYGYFGRSLALAGDRLIVGAVAEDHSGFTDTGAVYAYHRSGGNSGTPQLLLFSDIQGAANFGHSVALHGDTLIGGAIGALGSRGACYAFRETAGSWSEVELLFASDGLDPDQLGWSLGYDGTTVVSGAVSDGHGAGYLYGSAYVFEVASGSGGPSAPRDVALGDANGDGELDALTANSASHDLGLWLGDGTGALAAPVSVALTAGDLAPVAVAFGDLDGDGAADDAAVACSDSHTVSIVLNVGGSPSASSMSCGGLRPIDIVCGDFDGNGIDDVFVAREGELLAGGEGLAFSLNGGPFGAFSFGSYNVPRKILKLAIGDLDGDSRLDLVALASGSTSWLLPLYGDGNLTFVLAAAQIPSGLVRTFCLDDFNGDGALDIAAPIPVLFPLPETQVRFWINQGGRSGFLANPTDVASSGSFPVDIVSTELDGDSLPGFLTLRDLVVLHAGSGEAEVVYGYDSGSGSVLSLDGFAAGVNPVAADVGDLNADGAQDVVIANQGSDDLTVQFGQGGARALPFGEGCPGTNSLVPELSGIGLPTIGNAGFGAQLRNARPFAPYLLFLSGEQASLALGACTLYLAPPLISVLAFTDGAGEHAYGFGIPSAPELFGVSVYLQDAVFDPNGAFASTLALSNALRVQLGGPTTMSDERAFVEILGVGQGEIWMIDGPGFQIPRLQGVDSRGRLEYRSGHASGLSVTFEAMGQMAESMNIWFANGILDGRTAAIYLDYQGGVHSGIVL